MGGSRTDIIDCNSSLKVALKPASYNKFIFHLGLNVFSPHASKTKNGYIMYYHLLFTRFIAILMFEMLSEDSIFLKIFVTFNRCCSKINFSNDEENGITYFS